MNDKHKTTCHMNSLAHAAEGKQFALTCKGCECGVVESLPTMNEKELREAWMYEGLTRFSTDTTIGIADWWLARIHERDQRLKEKILSLPAATRSECETENVLCANDIINLIDNHD